MTDAPGIVALLNGLQSGWKAEMRHVAGSRTVVSRAGTRYDVALERLGMNGWWPYETASGLFGPAVEAEGRVVIGGSIRAVIDPRCIDTVAVRPVFHLYGDGLMTPQEALEMWWPAMEGGTVALRVHLDRGESVLYEQVEGIRTVTMTTADGGTVILSSGYQAPRDRIVDVEPVELEPPSDPREGARWQSSRTTARRGQTSASTSATSSRTAGGTPRTSWWRARSSGRPRPRPSSASCSGTAPSSRCSPRRCTAPGGRSTASRGRRHEMLRMPVPRGQPLAGLLHPRPRGRPAPAGAEMPEGGDGMTAERAVARDLAHRALADGEWHTAEDMAGDGCDPLVVRSVVQLMVRDGFVERCVVPVGGGDKKVHYHRVGTTATIPPERMRAEGPKRASHVAPAVADALADGEWHMFRDIMEATGLGTTSVEVAVRTMRDQGTVEARRAGRYLEFHMVGTAPPRPSTLRMTAIDAMERSGPRTERQIARAVYGSTSPRSLRRAHCLIQRMRESGMIVEAGRVPGVDARGVAVYYIANRPVPESEEFVLLTDRIRGLLAERGPMTARQVVIALYGECDERHRRAVSAMLSRMAKKGIITARPADGRSRVYSVQGASRWAPSWMPSRRPSGRRGR